MKWQVIVRYGGPGHMDNWHWEARSDNADRLTSSGHVIRATRRGAAKQAKRAIRKWERNYYVSLEGGFSFTYCTEEHGRGPA